MRPHCGPEKKSPEFQALAGPASPGQGGLFLEPGVPLSPNYSRIHSLGNTMNWKSEGEV